MRQFIRFGFVVSRVTYEINVENLSDIGSGEIGTNQFSVFGVYRITFTIFPQRPLPVIDHRREFAV